jgi:RecA/RadA recombinase
MNTQSLTPNPKNLDYKYPSNYASGLNNLMSTDQQTLQYQNVRKIKLVKHRKAPEFKTVILTEYKIN